jgi:hypothetical protein
MWRSRPHRSCARGPRGQGQPVRPCPRWKRLGLTRIGSVSPETGDACPSRKAGDLLNTIDRTGKVLNLFTAETPEWGVTEVATTLELPTSTTFDIVASLAEIGLLQQTSDDRYRLGWRVLVISRRLMTSTCFNAQTRNIVAEVANQLGAVVTLGAWDGQGVVCIANASGNRTERVLADEVHISRHVSALGKLGIRHQYPSCAAISFVRSSSQRDATTLPPNTVRPSPGSPALPWASASASATRLPRCRSACPRQGKPLVLAVSVATSWSP